jgi:uncharacterized protein involved in exopolysaccharide biosynthesis
VSFALTKVPINRGPSAGSAYVADASVLQAALNILICNWRWTVGLTIIGGLLALGGSFLIEPQYRAEARVSVVMDVDRTGGGAIGGAFGGLASLAGIQTQTPRERAESLAMLASRSLGEDFLVRENLMPDLFPDRWDAKSGKWIPENGETEPNIRDAFKIFARDVRVIQEDQQTGLVVVGMLWRDPARAADLTNKYVALANATMRARTIDESRASLQFLDVELGKTESIAVRESISRLVEQQTKAIMLANVRRDYAFKVIDPAVTPAPDDLARPRRLLMASVGALLGMALGVFLGILRGAR